MNNETKKENWYNSVKQDFSLAQKIVLFNEKNEILLMKAKNDEKWDLPGGHFEKNDTDILESLKREVAEEIGESVDFEILEEISVELRKYKGEFKNVKAVYLAKYNLGKIKLSEEHSDFQWISLAEIENLKSEDCKEWLQRVVEKAKIRLEQKEVFNSSLKNLVESQSKELNVKMIAVKAVILNQEKKVLILKRAKDIKNHPEKYDLPGGKMEKNETLEEALLREIEEETSLTEIKIESIIKTSEFQKEHPAFNEVKGLRFLVAYFGENDKVQLNENEHQSFEWLSFDEAAKRFSEEDGFEKEKKETLEVAKKYVENLESLSGWRRTLADFDNYKKRTLEREREFNQYATEKVIAEMLPVLNNFHSATDHIPETDQNNPWVMGIMYIQKQMEKVFEDNGVTEIEVKIGDDFKPEFMEAIKNDKNETEDSAKTLKVVKIVQKGYKIKEKVISPARVVVE